MKIYTLYDYDSKKQQIGGYPRIFCLNTRAVARWLQRCRNGEAYKGEAWQVEHETVPASELAAKLDEQLYEGRSYGLVLFRPSDAYDGSMDDFLDIEPYEAPKYMVFVNEITEKTPFED